MCVPLPASPRVSPFSGAWASVNFQGGRNSIMGLTAKPGAHPFNDGSNDKADPPYEVVRADTATTPQVITCDAVPWAQWNCKTYGIADKTVDVPTDMEPAGNTDHHFSFGSTAAQGEYDFWLVQSRIATAHGKLHIGGGGFCPWAGDGTACSGSNATNIAGTLGTITAADFARGESDKAHGTFGHAIAFSVLCADAAHVWPANASDGKNTDSYPACSGHTGPNARPPEGTRLFLNLTDEQVDALDLHEYEKAFWRTVDKQHFGGLIVDTTWAGGQGLNPVFQRDDFTAVAQEAGIDPQPYADVPIRLGGIALQNDIKFCVDGTC
jgi:hypothetical protein